MKTIKVNSLQELDKLVAEYVFGWTDFEPAWFSKDSVTYFGIPPEPNQHEWYWSLLHFDDGKSRVNVSSYSSDISAAYPLLISQADQYRIEGYPKNTSYQVRVIKDKETRVAQAKTTEIAICLAVLKTKDIEVELSILDKKRLEEATDVISLVLDLGDDIHYTEQQDRILNHIQTLNQEELDYCMEWAAKEYVHASDNPDVERLPFPECLRSLLNG